MFIAKMKFLLFIGALACLHLVSSQCTRESLDNSTVASLLASSLVAGTQSALPTVTVRNYTIVCLAVGTNINQYRLASVVVEYDCDGASCPGGVLSQVEFGCNNNVWSEGVSGTSEGNVVTPPAQATLRTQLRSDCHTCLNPTREPNSQEPHHCLPCSGCLPPDEGLNMCTGNGASQCCNVVINNGQCRDSCTPGTTPDPDFICRASCGDSLPTAQFQNEALDDSNCTYVGCNATYTCDEGLTLSDLTSTSYQLRCLESGWDPNKRTCSQRPNFVHNPSASESIMIEYDPPGCENTFGTRNCVATYTCINESASCNSTLNATTGVIVCFSEEVARLIMDTPCPTTTTISSTPTITSTIAFSPTPIPTKTPERKDDDDSTTTIIIAVVCSILGAAVIILIIGILLYYFCCYKKEKEEGEGKRKEKDTVEDEVELQNQYTDDPK